MGAQESDSGKLLYDTRTKPRTLDRKRIVKPLRGTLKDIQSIWMKRAGIIQQGYRVTFNSSILNRVTRRITTGLIAHYYPHITMAKSKIWNK